MIGGLWVLNLLSRGLVVGLLAHSNPGVAAGQFWRLVTAGFTTVGLFGLLLNVLVLWLVGRVLEGELGAWRLGALFLVSGLGGATCCFVFGPPGLAAVGGSWSLLGLLATNAVGKYKTREDIRPDLGLLALIVLSNVLLSFGSFAWLGLIGGAVVGAVAGAMLAYAPRANRTAVQVFGLVGVVLVCFAAVASKIWLG